MHIYKYTQPQIIIFLHPQVSVNPVTISRVSYSKNIIVQKCMIKSLYITLMSYTYTRVILL